MLCQKCQQRPATVFFSQTVGTKTTQTHLCEPCAREQMKAQGVVTPFALNPFAAMADFFNNFMAGANIQEAAQGRAPVSGTPSIGDPSVQCPYCGYQLSTFRQNGRLGCTRCYEAFAGFLGPLVASIHGNVRHTEEVSEKANSAPPGAPIAAPLGEDAEVLGLREQLKTAIQNEKFEEAARLRDEIQKRKDPPLV